MGKGDKKTRRGKIYRGSHGNARPHKPQAQATDPAAGKSKPAPRRTARRPAARKKAT